MPVEVLKRAMNRFPAAQFVQGFGMTELSGNVLFFDPASHVRAVRERPEMLAAAGRPMALSSLRVVDDEMNDVGVGEVGEIVVQGDQVMQGYWRNPVATEEAFAGGWFHTGDLARFDHEGYHYIVDRKKDMFISGGENIYPAEVELVLATLGGVAEACVIGVPDARWGEVGRAIVVSAPGAALDSTAVLQHLGSRLARYKIPKSVVFTDALPRNSTGKVLRQRVRERFGA
jgi:acyl-CoA synthetase (AMP-forming)/AMP-acid ligase II